MGHQICICDYEHENAQELVNIYFNTIHRINTQHYTEVQVDAWAPKSNLNIEKWTKKFSVIQPLVAFVQEKIVGFAGLEGNGHIDCFYCHHNWIGQGIGSALMKEITKRAKVKQIHRLFAEVSITAKPFFEKHGFIVLCKQNDCKGVKITNYKMEKLVN